MDLFTFATNADAAQEILKTSADIAEAGTGDEMTETVTKAKEYLSVFYQIPQKDVKCLKCYFYKPASWCARFDEETSENNYCGCFQFDPERNE